MRYIYYFDIAAIFLEILIVVFFYFKKYLPTKQNKIFLIFVYDLLVVTILDAVTSLDVELGGFAPRPVTYLLNCLYLIGTTSFGVLFTFYTVALAKIWDSVFKKKKIVLAVFFHVPFLISFVMILLSPFINNPTLAVFYLDEANLYHRGTFMFYLLYGISAFYLLTILVLLITYRKTISKSNRILILLYFITIIVSVAIQFFFPSLLVECFGIALTCLTFLFFIQRPEEVIDSTTELFNQTAFLRIYPGLVKENDSLTIIAVSLNDIVFLTNSLGIGVLNNFLNQIAFFLREHFSYYNLFALAQGRFCVVLKDPSDGEVSEAVNVITSKFKSSWNYQEIKLKLYNQICVVKCPDEANSPEEFYDIINSVFSGDRYTQPVVYAKNIDLEYKHELASIEYAVRKGLSDNRYEIYYQPIYSTKDQRVIGGEALIRLRDDNGNFINPEVFIPIAEKNGNVLRIGEFVFETVCRDLSRLNLENEGIKKIDINLSVAQCMQEILADQLVTIQTVYQIPTEVINLEITESALAHTPEIMMRNINNLVNAGFEFSLDDYGSGYSNLNYMINMPFSMIKIDKYIVWAALKNERAEIALRSTINMVKELGMTVLAEGVESREQMDWLIGLGCDYLQGYYYSKPCPFNEFLPLLKKEF